MNALPFVVAAYVVAAVGIGGMLLWSWAAMRKAERGVDRLGPHPPPPFQRLAPSEPWAASPNPSPEGEGLKRKTGPSPEGEGFKGALESLSPEGKGLR